MPAIGQKHTGTWVKNMDMEQLLSTNQHDCYGYDIIVSGLGQESYREKYQKM